MTTTKAFASIATPPARFGSLEIAMLQILRGTE
jgi:hypothetical protein